MPVGSAQLGRNFLNSVFTRSILHSFPTVFVEILPAGNQANKHSGLPDCLLF